MNICIFTVIKNERDYLNDFLKYHTEMGLHIFVFEDLFSDSHYDICKKYDNVFLHSITELYAQDELPDLIDRRTRHVPSQTDFINRGLKYIYNLNLYDWCWLIDIDEYITATCPFPDMLNDYKDYSAVSVYWMNYGCSGHLYKPVYDRPIYDIYLERCGYELHRDRKYSNITKFCVNMHKWNDRMKYKIHNAMVNWIKVDFTRNHAAEVFEPLYLRHYITKSFEEYCHKVYVRGMHHPGHRNLDSFFEMQPQYKEQIINDKKLIDYIDNKYNIRIAF